MKKDIVIIGSGGIGREVAYFIEEINKENDQWNILGFIDDNKDVHGKILNGYNVLGGVNELLSLNSKPYVVIAIANCEVKSKIAKLLNNEFDFATIVHPSVRVGELIKIGKGSIIYPGVILTVNTEIGEHVLISGNCGIGHDSLIGNYTTILWDCNLSGYNTIGEACYLSIGSILNQMAKVSDNTKINQGMIVK
ncbi:MAG: transferase [Clostridium sp.]